VRAIPFSKNSSTIIGDFGAKKSLPLIRRQTAKILIILALSSQKSNIFKKSFAQVPSRLLGLLYPFTLAGGQFIRRHIVCQGFFKKNL